MKTFTLSFLTLFLSSFCISGFSATVVLQKGQWVIQKDSKKKQASPQKKVAQPKIPTKSATAPAKKEQKKDEAKKNETRERRLVMVNLYGDSNVKQALDFLGKFYDDCQPASGRNSQSQQIECLDRCQSDQSASTDPRASGGSGRTVHFFSRCNGKHCLSGSYSRRKDGSLKINFAEGHPDLNASSPKRILDYGPREETSIKHNEYGYETTCRGSYSCIIDSQGRGTALDAGDIYRDDNGNGCSGQSPCQAIVDAKGNVEECVGSGCVMNDEEEGGFGGTDDSTEETVDSTDTTDNPDDSEDEDCSRASGWDGSGCSTLRGLELVAYEFFKQKELREKMAMPKPSVTDPSPIQGQTTYRTRLTECRGQNPRQGSRIRPREDRPRCHSYEVGFDDGSNEDQSCEEDKISQSKRPRSQGGSRRGPGRPAPDPSPVHQR